MTLKFYSGGRSQGKTSFIKETERAIQTRTQMIIDHCHRYNLGAEQCQQLINSDAYLKAMRDNLCNYHAMQTNTEFSIPRENAVFVDFDMANGSNIRFHRLDMEVKFQSNYQTIWKPDERDCAIDEKLAQYYRDTPDSMDNKQAAKYYRVFSEWCRNSGYTPEEISRSKKRVARLSKFL